MTNDRTADDAGTRAAMTDDELCADLARRAGHVLLELRERTGFSDPAALRTAGDRASQEFLAAELAAHRPDDAVLSEEAADTADRLGASRVWIVDPLDGTREYAEEGRDDWAVHVALWQDGRLAAGAVALPARDRTLATRPALALPVPSDTAAAAPLRIAVSRTRPPASVAKLAAALGAEMVPMGSAGVKISAVVLGTVDAYVHGGGQYEWDSAAPVAVALAAGAHASRLDGSPLVYNRRDPRLPDLLVCRPGVADTLLREIALLDW
ncbi:3'(2'),5'-bisphosphate nucleotidase CysQ [Streptomyces rimosus]|uniref:3'(2'),5'-bisphosphate nucleotidase CysQ n=1 Tax=Streptomyces rimosus TaxID=1927 RepID=UPI00099B4B1B|nr:3'(2'),5'-bisphosphate nucleotidase CysQ [Streptomyces rimosus]